MPPRVPVFNLPLFLHRFSTAGPQAHYI